MTGTVSRNDPRPLYKQLKDRLLETLADSRLPASFKLASERELVASYGVSRITVRQAMKELVNDGYIRSHPGKGFYSTGKSDGPAFEIELLRSFTATAIEHGMRPGGRLLHLRTEPAAVEVASKLHLLPGEPVVTLRRLRLLDGSAVAIAEDWMDARKVPGLGKLDWSGQNRSLYEELRFRYALSPQSGETILSSRLAAEDEGRLLDLAPPAAVLEVRQIAYDANGTPINFTLSVHHPTRYLLRLEQGVPPHS
jgi:GntR family transcriptional regulator